MRIRLFEPWLKQTNGFFRFFYSALIEQKNAIGTDAPRPLPRLAHPRGHESAWVQFDDHLVFFDMSDHTFFYDLDALRMCSVYFKANLNRQVTNKVLSARRMIAEGEKIVPFFFFASHLESFQVPKWKERILLAPAGIRFDLSHIVGVYVNPLKEGGSSVFQTGEAVVAPDRYHFWIRHHCQQACRKFGVNGYFRLTSRGNGAIEDNRTVFPNLPMKTYRKRMLQSRISMINILPHAVLPWKATESLALGRPLIMEMEPLIEMPEPFRLVKDQHYLEFLPGAGQFDPEAGPDDFRSYRVHRPIDIAFVEQRAAWLRDVLSDKRRVEYLQRQAAGYSREVLRKPVVADYICAQVRKKVH